MAVDGAHNDVLVAINDNKEVEIVECQVRIWIWFVNLSLHWIISIELRIELGNWIWSEVGRVYHRKFNK